MDREYFIDFIKLLIYNGYNHYEIKLKNDSVITIYNSENYVYFGLQVMEIIYKGKSRFNIQVSYDFIKDIKFYGNEKVKNVKNELLK